MINISNVKNYMVIMIENPIEWEVDISKLGRYTSRMIDYHMDMG